MDLESRLKKCCCKNINFFGQSGIVRWVTLYHNKKKYSFFAPDDDKLEQLCLSSMREVNRDLNNRNSSWNGRIYMEPHREDDEDCNLDDY